MSPKCVLYLFVMLTVVTAKSSWSNDRRGDPDAEEKKEDKTNDDNPTTTSRVYVGDAVVEKFAETLMANERYLKMIESVKRKLNHLDAALYEKSRRILEYVAEILRVVKTSPTKMLEEALTEMKHNLDRLKQSVAIRLTDRPTMRTEGTEFRGEGSLLDNRLSSMENLLRNVMSGVDSIVATMAEVKNRQQLRTFTSKPNVGSPLDSISELKKILYEQRQTKCDCRSGRVDRAERYPTDCHEIQMQGFNISGIYKIKPDEMEPFYILCDLTTAGGGWTVFQNRYDGSQDFFKGWSDYKYGFGNLAGEFWLGLEKLNYLTNQKLYELRVEIETQHGQEAYAGYSVFTIGPEYEGFRISTLGTFYGTAGDSLSYHAGQKFSTLDADNDEWKDGSCSIEHGGAWWYKECDKSNLNGKYAPMAEENRGQSMYWISFKGPNHPLTKTKMMLRPLPASKPVDFGNPNRGRLEGSRLRSVHEKVKNIRTKESKGLYDRSHRLSSSHSRFEDDHADAFFPNDA